MFKILFYLLFFIGTITSSSFSQQNCFILKEDDQFIIKEGNCFVRHAPCSTFKIALSLIGFNEGILRDEYNPKWPFKNGYADALENWKQPHTPITWIKHSCVWFSQQLTQNMGSDVFKKYVNDFDYGHGDISGDVGQNNGLTHSWLSSSLEISPVEQSVFLEKLIHNKLPVSIESQSMTKTLLFLEDLPKGWKLYGKTGSGSLLNKDRTEKTDHQIGWFIGWIQKEDRALVFVQFIQDVDKQETYASLRAKAMAKEKLIDFILKK